MKRALLSTVLAAGVIWGLAPPALAHDGKHGTYDSAGGHLTHLNPVAWQTLLPASMAAGDPTAKNVEHVANIPGNTGGHVVTQDDRLYMGNYGTGFTIYDNSNPAAPVKIGQWMPGPKDAADPGARADAVPDVWAVDVDGTRRHIVAFGGTSRHSSTIRTEFVDATDPSNLKLLWTFTGSSDGESHNSDVLDARGLWIPSGGSPNGGLRIFDLRPLLQDPPAAPINIMRTNPNVLWNNSPHRTGPPDDNYSHTHDVEAYLDYQILLPEDQWVDQDEDGIADPTREERDILLMVEGGNYLDDNGDTGSMYIVDITDPTQPVVLNWWKNNPAVTGLSAIRYYHEVQFVKGLDNVIVVTDEDLHNGCGAGGMVVLQAQADLSKPLEPKSQWFNASDGDPHLAPVCSMHVMSSKDGYLYDGSYNAGLQVIDLRDPAAPKEAGRFAFPGQNSWGALAHGDYVYTGDFGARGLDVFKFTPPADATGLVNPNPATLVAGGVNESTCEAGDVPTVDGLRIAIPDAFADGSHKLEAIAPSGAADTELDIWFYGPDCAWIEDDRTDTGAREIKIIPAGAGFSYVVMPSGAPRTRVDAYLD
ncbi:MAG: hypothetical protein GEU78_00365 [Actinobacteria bacterium]|nr:hypothetical protein [Actinomycetota bacterium]